MNGLILWFLWSTNYFPSFRQKPKIDGTIFTVSVQACLWLTWGADMAEQIRPWTSIYQGPQFEPCPAVVLYPHCLVFRRRLEAVSPVYRRARPYAHKITHFTSRPFPHKELDKSWWSGQTDKHTKNRGYYLETDPDPIAMVIRVELVIHKPTETNAN